MILIKYSIIINMFCIWNLFSHNGTMTHIMGGPKNWRIAQKNIQQWLKTTLLLNLFRSSILNGKPFASLSKNSETEFFFLFLNFLL
jgi:hypothetical protein